MRSQLNPVWFVAAFPVMWLAMTGLFASVGGWSRLAERFPESRAPVESSLSSIALGLVSYKNAVFVGFSEEGIHLRALFLFRLRHPPIMIPWSAVCSMKFEKRTWSRWSGSTVLVLDAGRPMTLTLRREIPRDYQGSLPVAS